MLLDRRARLRQNRVVITGYNTDIKHGGRVYHVQTEDKGLENPTIESLVYAGGKIVASRQYSYARLLKERYSEKAVQDLVDAQHRKMLRDVRGGKFEPEGPPSFGAGIITQRSFDEVVLSFLRSHEGAESIELVLEQGSDPRAGQPLPLSLAVRTQAREAPVVGAQVVVRLQDGGGGSLTLFEGMSDEAGRVGAEVKVPKDAAGSMLTVTATSSDGSDQLALEVLAS